MSYKTARDQLVSILQAITPSDNTIYQGKFQQSSAATGKNVTSRSFWLEANVDGPGVIRGPDLINVTQSPLQVVTMTLTVTYRAHDPRQSEADTNLESDRTDIARALLNQNNWNRTTSGIENVCDGREFMKCTRSRDGSSVLMKFTFPLTYR